MPRFRPIMLAAWLAAALIQACSQAEPTPREFTRVSQSPAAAEKARQAEEAFKTAETLCKAETKRKGIASVVGIFSRLRKGSADDDYIACMKQRGYEVKS